MCEIRLIQEGEILCSVCYPKFKLVLLKYAKGFSEFKREGMKMLQLKIEFPYPAGLEDWRKS